MGIWDEVKEAIIENQGDISGIDKIPQHTKDIYKTSFTTSPYAYIEVAARAQKWIDQALSRNMYLETRDVDETMKIYSTAWEKGLKSTYYLHMKPRHTAEQSTTNVNKAQKIGKVGFGALNFVNSPAFSAPLQKSLKIEEPVPSSPLFVPEVPSSPVHFAPSVPVPATSIPMVESKQVETSDYLAAEAMQVMEREEEPMVSVRITHPAPVGFAAVSQRAEIPKQTEAFDSQEVVGPEDPAEEEGNICIDCQ